MEFLLAGVKSLIQEENGLDRIQKLQLKWFSSNLTEYVQYLTQPQTLRANVALSFTQNNGDAQEVKHYHLHLIPSYETFEELKDIEDIYNKLI